MKTPRLIIPIVLVFLAATKPAFGADLDAVYAAELAELEAERDRMLKELDHIREQNRKDIDSRRGQILFLGDRLMQLRLESDKAESDLARLEDLQESGLSKRDQFDSAIDQASTTLLKAGEEPFDVDQDPLELIPRVFTAAKSLLEARASISTRDGSYFMKSGLEAKGKILMLGPMAAFASGPESGLLALAGTDSFRVVHAIPPETLAPIFDEGRFLEVTPVFLIDRLAGMDVDDREKTVLEHLKSGGIIVWPIIGLGLLAVLIFIERVFTLTRLGFGTDKLIQKVLDYVTAGHVTDAEKACEGKSNCASRVMEVALKNRGICRKDYESLVNETLLAQQNRLERFLQLLNVIAAVAPLLGLLGTVTGMIATFDVITTHGTGNPKLLSGGISEALVTTELGLIVAIPVLLLHAFLASWVDKISGNIERAALKLSAALNCGFAQKTTADDQDDTAASDQDDIDAPYAAPRES